jgi:hypothetical protein
MLAGSLPAQSRFRFDLTADPIERKAALTEQVESAT